MKEITVKYQSSHRPKTFLKDFYWKSQLCLPFRSFKKISDKFKVYEKYRKFLSGNFSLQFK